MKTNSKNLQIASILLQVQYPWDKYQVQIRRNSGSDAFMKTTVVDLVLSVATLSKTVVMESVRMEEECFHIQTLKTGASDVHRLHLDLLQTSTVPEKETFD